MTEKKEFDISKPEGFKQAFMAWSDALRNFLYYKSGDLQLAEDLCQEAFLRLWKQRENVTEGKEKSFLFTIGNNLFLDKMRHEKVKRNYKAKYVAPDSPNDPLFSLEEKEFKERLEKAIAALPESQREVFLMNRIEKLTYREIAEILELSVKAIEKRMSKAIKELRKLTQKI